MATIQFSQPALLPILWRIFIAKMGLSAPRFDFIGYVLVTGAK
jgi:hypothetical protein